VSDSGVGLPLRVHKIGIRSHLFRRLTQQRNVHGFAGRRRRRRGGDARRRLLIELDGRAGPASPQAAAAAAAAAARSAQSARLRLEPVEARTEHVQQRLQRIATGRQRVSQLRGSVSGRRRLPAAARVHHRRAAHPRSVFVQEADAARRDVAVVAEVQAEVACAVDVAAQTHRILQPQNHPPCVVTSTAL